MTFHELKDEDVKIKAQEDCVEFLKKYGIENMIHSKCSKLKQSKCQICNKTVNIKQFDEHDNFILGSLLESLKCSQEHI